MRVVVEHSMADFFRDVARLDTPPPGPPSADEIAAVMAACARHKITLLGGPPS